MKGNNKYAAKLLFQYRVVIDGDSNKKRTSEELIVTLSEKSAKAALQKAKTRGKGAQHNYINDDGNSVYFEFVGVVELLHLGIECEDDEVWYEIKDYLTPMECKDKFIPPENTLSAIKYEREQK